MTGVRAVYHLGQDYGPETVTWEDGGVLVDLTDGWTLQLEVFPFAGEVVFTKTDGLTPQAPVDGIVPDPNLIVLWDGPADLELLAPGTYVQYFKASKGADNLAMFAELVIRENAPNAAYCEIGDLLLGDLELSPNVNRYTYMNGAADEINSRLGYIYELPLRPAPPATEISTAAMLVLKNINAKLASGRLLCAIATGGEEDSVNAYGLSLIHEAWAELQLVLDGSLPLLGAQRSGGDTTSAFAETSNGDASSSMDAFYDEFWGFKIPTYPPFPIFGGVWEPKN